MMTSGSCEAKVRKSPQKS